MDDEQPAKIVIVLRGTGCPSVACDTDAHVHIVDENGEVWADFPAQSLLQMAARGLAQ